MEVRFFFWIFFSRPCMGRIRVLVFYLLDFSSESKQIVDMYYRRYGSASFLLDFFSQGSVWVGIRVLIFHLLDFSFESKQIVEVQHLRYGNAFFLLDFFSRLYVGRHSRFDFS